MRLSTALRCHLLIYHFKYFLIGLKLENDFQLGYTAFTLFLPAEFLYKSALLLFLWGVSGFENF